MTLEVLIPARNPTGVFRQTIESLAAQTDKNFSVLVSDNFSTQGMDEFDHALKTLAAAGIAARKIRPPQELGRVEHWNWLHQQSEADWLKPLFAGDWLESSYMERLRETVRATPSCQYVFSNGYTHRPGEQPWTAENLWTGKFNSPAEMQKVVLSFGMQFGPPSAAAYARKAFVLAGGYDPKLPICADSYLFCKMAALFGAAGMSDRLFHFQIHGARFSHDLRGKRWEPFRESMIYYFKLLHDVRAAGGHVPVVGFLRLLARACRGYLFPKRDA